MNHFIEIGKDDQEHYYITTHSGSRNLGLRIAEYWQNIAVNNIAKCNNIDIIKATYPKEQWQEQILKQKPHITKGLETLYGYEMYQYLIDTIFAGFYAHTSHSIMLATIANILNIEQNSILEHIKTIHNYINTDDFIIRKGAVAAYAGQKFILPFNMEDGILICEGKGNPDWNFSAPHGAGRVLSRSKAKEQLSLEEAKISMESKGIYCSTLPIDELKGAYKPSKLIEDAIEPTATIISRVKPILNLKANG